MTCPRCTAHSNDGALCFECQVDTRPGRPSTANERPLWWYYRHLIADLGPLTTAAIESDLELLGLDDTAKAAVRPWWRAQANAETTATVAEYNAAITMQHIRRAA